MSRSSNSIERVSVTIPSPGFGERSQLGSGGLVGTDAMVQGVVQGMGGQDRTEDSGEDTGGRGEPAEGWPQAVDEEYESLACERQEGDGQEHHVAVGHVASGTLQGDHHHRPGCQDDQHPDAGGRGGSDRIGAIGLSPKKADQKGYEPHGQQHAQDRMHSTRRAAETAYQGQKEGPRADRTG